MFTRKAFVQPLITLVLATSTVLAISPALAATDFPTGTYAAKGVAETVTFGDGQLLVNRGGVMKDKADYTVKGDQLQLTDKSGPWACTKAGEQTGTYHWKYDSGILAFSKIADKCEGRAAWLTKYSWKKQK
ncbi:MAG: hypothetical protein ACRESI_06240 [Gammaproteobacteria bacterium]